MKNFIIRAVNALLILFILCGYHSVASAREAQDAARKAEAEAENARIEEEERLAAEAAGLAEEYLYADGVYTGEAEGFGGTIRVSVTIADGVITDLTIDSAEDEDEAYLSIAGDIIDDILEAQSADVDTVSGATFSSTGIKNAAAAALKEAEN